MDMGMTSMIYASIVLYNTKIEDVRKVLGCVAGSIVNKVYVIDNSEQDTLREEVLAASKKTEYIWGQGNVGYGAGHNIAIRRSIEESADYHLVLNPDIFFESDVIADLVGFMSRYVDVGMVLPRVVYPNGDLQYLCRLLPAPLDIFSRRFLPKSVIKKRNERYEMRAMGYDKVWNCPILSGCFMLMRVNDLARVGGFDERFFMYFEDFDLMRRLHRISKTVFYPHRTIIHDHASGHHTSRFLFRASIKSAYQYFNKWGWLLDRERVKENRGAFDAENQISD